MTLTTQHKKSTAPVAQLCGRPRVLVCTAGVPHPTDGASTVLFFHYVRHLCNAGYEVLHLMLLEGSTWSEMAVSDYVAKLKSSGAIEVFVARSPKFISHGRTAHRLDRAALTKALDRAKQFDADLILAFDLMSAWTLAEVPAPRRIVWLGDLHFQTMWAHAVYATRENLLAAVHLPSIWLVCRAWKRLYGRVLAKADQVLVASAASRGVLAPLGINAEYEPYPWPEIVPSSFDRPPLARPTFLFFGSLGGLGSRSALHFTVNKLYPRLRRIWGENGFSILIAGKGRLPEWFAKAIDGKSEFRHVGYVEHIDGLMAQCHAVLVPIDVPVGNRSRILTAMAKGALVIAHSNVSLGNPDLVDGETCYLSKDAAGFVERMQRAVLDKRSSRAIIERAHRCYETRFHPNVAGPKLVGRVAALVGENRL